MTWTNNNKCLDLSAGNTASGTPVSGFYSSLHIFLNFRALLRPKCGTVLAILIKSGISATLPITSLKFHKRISPVQTTVEPALTLRLNVKLSGSSKFTFSVRPNLIAQLHYLAPRKTFVSGVLVRF